MNCKVVVAVCVAACIQMLHAADADEKFLREHAIECIDSLNVFSAPQYAVQKMLKPVLDKDSLSLELDSVRVAEVDTLLKHWVDKCGNLFDPEVYTPGFLRRLRFASMSKKWLPSNSANVTTPWEMTA